MKTTIQKLVDDALLGTFLCSCNGDDINKIITSIDFHQSYDTDFNFVLDDLSILSVWGGSDLVIRDTESSVTESDG